MLCGELAADHARQALERGDLSAKGLSAYGHAFHRKYDWVQRSARVLRYFLSSPWMINRSVRRASTDTVFADALGHVILGVSSPLTLLHPNMTLRLLMG